MTRRDARSEYVQIYEWRLDIVVFCIYEKKKMYGTADRSERH